RQPPWDSGGGKYSDASAAADLTAVGAKVNNTSRRIRSSLNRVHLDAATGAPASGTASSLWPEPETPGGRPALHHSISPLVVVSRCARLDMPLRKLGSEPVARRRKVTQREMFQPPLCHYLPKPSRTATISGARN